MIGNRIIEPTIFIKIVLNAKITPPINAWRWNKFSKYVTVSCPGLTPGIKIAAFLNSSEISLGFSIISE